MLIFEKAVEIYKQIIEIDNQFLLDEMHEKMIKYARIRTDWHFMPMEERSEHNKRRSIAHNALIDSLNAISRFMEENEMSTFWREEITNDRRIIGNWACFVHAYLGVKHQ